MDNKSRTVSQDAFDFNLSAVLGDHLVSDRQPQTGTLVLGREKRIEDIFEFCGRNTGTGVLKNRGNSVDAGSPRFCLRWIAPVKRSPDMQLTTLRHGLNRIANQIVKRSGQLACIGPNRRHIIGNCTTTKDVPGLQLRIGCVQHLLQQGLEVSALKYILGNPGQIQEILHQGIDPVQFPRNGPLEFFKKNG